MRNYYQILNVSKGASQQEIKTSFRKLAVIHHPDKNNGSKSSEEYFKLLLLAYETLIDLKKREVYDSKIQESQKQNVPNSNPWKEQTASKEAFKKSYSKPQSSNYKTKYKANEFWFNIWFACLIGVVLSVSITSFLREREKTKLEVGTHSENKENFKKSVNESKYQSEPKKEEYEESNPHSGEIDF